MESTFDQFISRSSVCVSFVENLSAFEFYILGALRGALDIRDQERVLRYRAALIQEGTDGKYSKRTRDMVVNIVAQNAGGIDLSKDKIEVSKRDELTQLLAALKSALEPIETVRQDDADRVVRTAELVAMEVAKPKPDKSFLDISIEGLKKAAKTVEDVAPAVLSVASKIAAFVAGI